MATKSCTSCLRAVRFPARIMQKTSRTPLQYSAARTLMTTPSLYAESLNSNVTISSSLSSISSNTTAGTPSAGLNATKSFQKVAGRGSMETYTAYGVTEALIKECSIQADYSIPQAQSEVEDMPKTANGEDLGVGSGWWHSELGLQPTFSTWSQVTMLHMYLLSVRFRCFEPQHSGVWQQHLVDHFFYDAENKMTINHNMNARGTRNKYLKDMFVQWRGLLAAYDEGLVKGDAVLAAAVWRNVFKADEDVNVKSVATIVSYMRRLLKGLDSMPDENVMMGNIKFGDLKTEMDLVSERSKLMDMPFKDRNTANEVVATKA